MAKRFRPRGGLTVIRAPGQNAGHVSVLWQGGTDPFANMLYTNKASDRAIIEAVAAVAQLRGVSRSQIALAWLRRNPVVVAPIVGASKASHIDDAVASLAIDLTDEEVTCLEQPTHLVTTSRAFQTTPISPASLPVSA